MAVNGGLFGYAGRAKEETEIARDKELIMSAIVGWEIEKQTGNKTFVELLAEEFGEENVTPIEGGAKVSMASGRKYIVRENGEIIYDNSQENLPESTDVTVQISGENEVTVGENITLTASLTPQDVDENLTWTSQNGKVTIASSGSKNLTATVTGVTAGSDTIIVKNKNNETVAQYNITVNTAVETISFSVGGIDYTAERDMTWGDFIEDYDYSYGDFSSTEFTTADEKSILGVSHIVQLFSKVNAIVAGTECSDESELETLKIKDGASYFIYTPTLYENFTASIQYGKESDNCTIIGFNKDILFSTIQALYFIEVGTGSRSIEVPFALDIMSFIEDNKVSEEEEVTINIPISLGQSYTLNGGGAFFKNSKEELVAAKPQCSYEDNNISITLSSEYFDTEEYGGNSNIFFLEIGF